MSRFLCAFPVVLACVGCVGDSPNTPPADAATNDTATNDTGGGPDAAADAPPSFAPSDFGPRLVLWLDANEASTVTKSGNDVTAWADRSGKNNGALAGARLNGGSITTTTSSGIGGKAALAFNLASMKVNSSTSLELGTGEFLVEVVALLTPQGDFDRYILAKYNDNAKGFAMLGPDATLAISPSPYRFGAFLDYNDKPHVSPTNAPVDGQAFRVYGMHRLTATTLEARVNGGSTGPVTVPSQNLTNVNPLVIGASSFVAPGPNNPLASSQIAEIVMVSGSASTKEVTDLEDYFKKKYSLAF